MGNKSISPAEIKSRIDCMGDISTQTKNDIVEFMKNEHVFGKLHNNKMSLMNDCGDFREVSLNIIYDTDEFLKRATQAYWIASNRARFRDRSIFKD